MTGPNGTGMTNLGTFGGTHSGATGINAAGQVVGFFSTADGSSHAFMTGPKGVGFTALGTFGGTSASAYGINSRGQVLAQYSTGFDPANQHTFLTGPNGLGGMTVGGPGTLPDGINDAGQVSGNLWTTNHAFITGPNGIGITDLGTLGGYFSWSSSLNGTGQVVGSSTTTNSANSAQHAFITGPNGTGMTDLGTLSGEGYRYSFALGVNAAGQVVGFSFANEGYHAFVTGTNGMGMTDLNSLVSLLDGVILLRAVGINDSGQIIADASFGNGPIYLLSPVPEPGSYVLMLAGLGLLGFLACRRKQIGALPRYG